MKSHTTVSFISIEHFFAQACFSTRTWRLFSKRLHVVVFPDAPSAVKLHLAFLQYPVIEFYSLSQDGEHSRDALIALAWLLGTQNVLTTILRAKLADGVLGAECSHVDSSEVSIETFNINMVICNVFFFAEEIESQENKITFFAVFSH